MNSAIFIEYLQHRLRFPNLSIQAESTETKIKPLFKLYKKNIINMYQLSMNMAMLKKYSKEIVVSKLVHSKKMK